MRVSVLDRSGVIVTPFKVFSKVATTTLPHPFLRVLLWKTSLRGNRIPIGSWRGVMIYFLHMRSKVVAFARYHSYDLCAGRLPFPFLVCQC